MKNIRFFLTVGIISAVLFPAVLCAQDLTLNYSTYLGGSGND